MNRIFIRERRKGRWDTSFIPWHNQMKIPPWKKRISRYGESSLSSVISRKKLAIKKATPGNPRPRRCRGGINGGTYTIVSRLNRGTKRKKKRKKKEEDSTERDGRNFLISSQNRAGVGNKERPSDSPGNGLSLLFNTHYHHTLRFSCYLFPRISRPRGNLQK